MGSVAAGLVLVMSKASEHLKQYSPSLREKLLKGRHQCSPVGTARVLVVTQLRVVKKEEKS